MRGAPGWQWMEVGLLVSVLSLAVARSYFRPTQPPPARPGLSLRDGDDAKPAPIPAPPHARFVGWVYVVVALLGLALGAFHGCIR